MENPLNECGICFKVLDGKKKKRNNFGLLSSCNHVFCFKCLKRWRNVKNAELVDCCPECRQFAELVVPSRNFLTGKKKNKLLQKYRSNESLHNYCIVNKRPTKIKQQDPVESQRIWNQTSHQPPFTLPEIILCIGLACFLFMMTKKLFSL